MQLCQVPCAAAEVDDVGDFGDFGDVGDGGDVGDVGGVGGARGVVPGVMESTTPADGAASAESPPPPQATPTRIIDNTVAARTARIATREGTREVECASALGGVPGTRFASRDRVLNVGVVLAMLRGVLCKSQKGAKARSCALFGSRTFEHGRRATPGYGCVRL
jgi:hypothetical protein